MDIKSLILIGCMWATSAFAVDMEAIVSKLQSDDYAARLEARNELQQSLADETAPTTGSEESLSTIQEMVPLLGDVPLSERLYMIYMIELFGSAESAQAVAALLGDTDPAVRDSARRALSGLPGDAATKYLLNGLSYGLPEERGAYIDALVYRGDSGAASAIAQLLQSDDPELVCEVASALGKLDNNEVLPALLSAREKATGPSKVCCEFALVNLDLDAVSADLLTDQGANAAIRSAAFRQLCILDEARALNVISSILESPDFEGGERFLSIAMEKDFAQEYLVDALPKALPLDQCVIISAIGELGLSQYESQVLATIPSAPGDLYAAVIDTLSKVGGDASFEIVYDAFVANPKDGYIVAAVSRLRAPAADQQAMEVVRSSSEPSVRVAAMKFLELRNTSGATELLNQIAAGAGDDEVREAAFKSLEVIGDLASIRVLVNLIATQDALYKSAQRSLKRLTLNYGAGDYLWHSMYQPALMTASNDNAREALILILDGIAGEQSLAYLGSILVDGDSALKPAAIRTLQRWPTRDAGDQWIQFAVSDAASEKEKSTAKKAVIKLITWGSPKIEVDQIKLAAQAILEVDDADFRESILSLYSTPNGRQKRRLDAYLKYLGDDPTVAARIQEFLSAL
jgi:HEAT repeat protein